MATDWVPAGETERAMADALAAGDGARYATLLRKAPLFLPDMPEPGSEEEQQVAQLVPAGAAFVLAYTSVETLTWALGRHARGWQQLDLAALRQRWPDSRYQLAVNAGAPIAVYLPPSRVADLAEGRQSLVSLDEVRQVVADEALTQIRRACLRELTGEEPATALRDDPPANQLEGALRDAVTRQDSEAFVAALLVAEVVLPTADPVPDPEQIYEDGFPWRVTGGEQAPAVPVFSSAAALERTAPGERHWLDVQFLSVVASWPGEQYVLCFNPGSVTELVLPGGAVTDLVSSLADAMGQ